MEELIKEPYPFIIAASVVLIVSFLFGEISKKTSIPSVLLLIIFGVFVKLGMDSFGIGNFNFLPILKILGTVGLIMIVLEAALELKLERSKIVPILLALGIALVGLLLSTWLTAEILHYFIDFSEYNTPDLKQSKLVAWLYATPLSILSSAIIIPSVVDLRNDKKEFHIYESTFSDILGIMLFQLLGGMIVEPGTDAHASGLGSFALSFILIMAIALISSYMIVLIFQRISSSAKLFLLIATLLLVYSIGILMHLSSLIIILIFGLVIANMDLFFVGPLKKWLDKKKAHDIYHGLHVITLETAFVIRTFFFVVFGITIVFSSLSSLSVLGVSILCIAVIYIIRFILLRASLGSDINPQVYIAPRGLITILLFYKIPKFLETENFSQGILLFVIIGTSIIMTISLIMNKRRANKAIDGVQSVDVSEAKWKVPDLKPNSDS